MTTADDISPMYLVDMYAPYPIFAPSTHYFGYLIILVTVAHFLYHLTSSALLTGYLRFVQHKIQQVCSDTRYRHRLFYEFSLVVVGFYLALCLKGSSLSFNSFQSFVYLALVCWPVMWLWIYTVCYTYDA